MDSKINYCPFFVYKMLIMNQEEKEQNIADKLYLDAYNRWCNELSHDKNHLKAKDIALYLINNNIDFAKKYQLSDLEKHYSRIKILIEQK